MPSHTSFYKPGRPKCRSFLSSGQISISAKDGIKNFLALFVLGEHTTASLLRPLSGPLVELLFA